MMSKKILPIASGLVILALIAGAFVILHRQESDATLQTTDDAYVQADATLIAPQVAGIVATLNVEENQAVAVGAPLLSIDTRDFQVALDTAHAQVASAQAAISSLQAQIARQHSLTEQAQATLKADEASLSLAEANQTRYTHLAQDGSGSAQAREQADAQVRIQHANAERDAAMLQAVGEQTAVMRADLDKARAALAQAQAAQAGAELNLAHAHLTAPVSGIVAQRSAQVGAYVSPGKPVLALVPLDALYVEANFRETQLAHMQVGQRVSLSVDALPGVRLTGHVQSLAPASGVSFSAVPAHNATGNFTKIVQRLPVRISLDANQPQAKGLRVGMSVRPEIQTAL